MAEMVRQRCKAMLERLRLPRRFTIEDVVRRVAVMRGRAIELRPIDLSGVSLSGMLLWTRERDIICYPTDTSGPHQAHIVAHELAHLLFDHSDTLRADRPHNGSNTPPSATLHALVPDVPPQTIQGALGRSSHSVDHGPYSQRAEREAELFATLLHLRAHTPTESGKPIPGWMFAGTT